MKHVAYTMLGLAVIAAEAQAQDVAMDRPEAPYVVSACPFECCTYRTWTFENGVDVRSAPADTASVVARIAANTKIKADSGHVRIDPLGLVYVPRDFTDSEVGRRYRAGDTLLVLDYLGEGYSHVWVRGERRQLQLGMLVDTRTPADSAPVRVLRDPVSTWWVHVTLPVGVTKDRDAAPRRGWVRMTGDVYVSGADACGDDER